MDLLHLSSLIIVSVLALCVIDVIRRPRLGVLVRARYDAEHPHPLARDCVRRPQRAGAPEAIRERGVRATHRNAPRLRQRAAARAWGMLYRRSPARGGASPRWHARCTSALAGRFRGRPILMDS